MFELELRASQRRAAAERETRRAQAAARLEAQRQANAAAALAAQTRDQQVPVVREIQLVGVSFFNIYIRGCNSIQAAEERKRAVEKEEAEQSAREAELLRTGGVSLSEELTPMIVDLSTRGIRRSADKIILPASLRDSLQHQRGHLMGQLAFELSTVPSGVRRHAVALEFTAPAGQVLLPPRLAEEFADSDGALPRKIGVKFVKLRTLSFARLQPLTREFRKEV